MTVHGGDVKDSGSGRMMVFDCSDPIAWWVQSAAVEAKLQLSCGYGSIVELSPRISNLARPIVCNGIEICISCRAVLGRWEEGTEEQPDGGPRPSCRVVVRVSTGTATHLVRLSSSPPGEPLYPRRTPRTASSNCSHKSGLGLGVYR